MKYLFVFLSILTVINSAIAAPKKTEKPATPIESSTTANESDVLQTDIIGSKEAPGVLNIVPWKDKKIASQKKEVNTSILRATLLPLDKEVLKREIQLQNQLQNGEK
jgi:hypothetical protein